MKISDIKVGDIIWDGPVPLLVLKIQGRSILIRELNPDGTEVYIPGWGREEGWMFPDGLYPSA